jgi:hypothetical protein
MKRVFHLVWFDFLRLRWVVAAWVVALVAFVVSGLLQIYVPITGVSNGPSRTWDTLLQISFWLWTVQLAGPYVLTQIIILGDPVSGGRAPWRTRPISGGRLLLAKLVTWLLLLVALPVVVATPWWWWCGLTWSQMAQASGYILVQAVVIGTPAACVAVLVDALSRALIWGLLVVPVAGGVLSLLTLANFLPRTFMVICAAGIVLGFVAIIVVQYLARTWYAKIGLVVAGIACAPVLLHAVDFVSRGLVAEPRRAAEVSTRLCAVGRNSVDLGMQISAPKGLYWRAEPGFATWQWPNARWSTPAQIFNSAPMPEAFGLTEIAPDRETLEWQKQRRDEFRRQHPEYFAKNRPQTPLLWTANAQARCYVSAPIAERILRDQPACVLSMDFKLYQPRRLDTFLATDHSWHATYGVGCRLEHGDLPDRLVVHETVFDPTYFAMYGQKAEVSYWYGTRRTHEVGELYPNWSSHTGVNSIFCVRVSVHPTTVSKRPIVRNGKWIASPQAVDADTEITVAELEPLGTFHRDMKVDHFRLAP